ncbi:MAG: hypothetical protein LBP56_03565 [Odoribacteraceae bacterium]|nr:hypothetical protein [Odoribacteraceae bacterium]
MAELDGLWRRIKNEHKSEDATGNPSTVLEKNLLFLWSSQINTTFASVRKTEMDIKFSKEYLRELYEVGKSTSKKYRFHPDVVKRYPARIKMLEKASRIEDLFLIRSLYHEKLHGDKEGADIS